MPKKLMQVMWPIDISHFPSQNEKSTAAVNDPMFLKKRGGAVFSSPQGKLLCQKAVENLHHPILFYK